MNEYDEARDDERDSAPRPTRGQQRRAEELQWLGQNGYTVCCGGGRGRRT